MAEVSFNSMPTHMIAPQLDDNEEDSSDVDMETNESKGRESHEEKKEESPADIDKDIPTTQVDHRCLIFI